MHPSPANEASHRTPRERSWGRGVAAGSISARGGSIGLGSVFLDGGLGDLSFRATTSLVADPEGPFKEMLNLWAELEVRDDGPRAVTLRTNACPLDLRRRPARSTEDFGDGRVDLGVDPVNLEPGATGKGEHYGFAVSLWDLRQRKIPDARDYFTCLIRLNDVPLEVIAGEVVLAISREPRPTG